MSSIPATRAEHEAVFEMAKVKPGPRVLYGGPEFINYLYALSGMVQVLGLK